jgi:hypothetical protein
MVRIKPNEVKTLSWREICIKTLEKNQQIETRSRKTIKQQYNLS